MKKILAILFIGFIGLTANSQTLEELKKELKSKKDSIAALDKKANAIQKKINALPGWKVGAFGTIGANFSRFNNWFAREAPNTSAGNIGFTVNAYANLMEEKYFWRNAANVNLAWVKLDDREDPTDSDSFEAATDVFNITSIFGYRLNKKWAISALAEYRTTFIENFNNPGYLDLGGGITWTPFSSLVVVMNPGNYNFVFSDADTNFESSLGAKIVADYTTKINKLSIKSNLSLFQSYDSSDLSNWTWINSLGYNIWNGIGLGFEFGLRNNRQEALNAARITDTNVTSASLDNKLQSYWLFGVSYAF